jgi:hypothetical protein
MLPTTWQPYVPAVDRSEELWTNVWRWKKAAREEEEDAGETPHRRGASGVVRERPGRLARVRSHPFAFDTEMPMYLADRGSSTRISQRSSLPYISSSTELFYFILRFYISTCFFCLIVCKTRSSEANLEERDRRRPRTTAAETAIARSFLSERTRGR